MLRIELHSAYVLHSRPYQETSLLVELFTQGHGRLAVVAKGARRPKSPTRGILQPFVPLLVSCMGRGELLTLKGADLAGGHRQLFGRRMISAFYLNELLMRLLHRFDPYQSLFNFYHDTLSALETAVDEQICLRIFEKNLLKALGYDLQLTTDVDNGKPIDKDNYYAFDPQHGPTEVPPPKRQQGVLKSPDIFKGRSLLALAETQWEDEASKLDAKRIMRKALSLYLGDKPLESRRLL